jgi:hypothetical protein
VASQHITRTGTLKNTDQQLVALYITRTGTIKNIDLQLVALSLFSAYKTITYEPTDGFVGYYDEKCEMKNQ